MEKRMEPVCVYVSDANKVCISTDDFGGDQVIILDPNQVDTIIQWLNEAKEEALENDAQ